MGKTQTELSDGLLRTRVAAASVDGWMSEIELNWLIKTASTIRAGGVVVEIGSYKGRSSVAIGRALQIGTVLYCIDSWLGDPYDAQDLTEDLYWSWLVHVFQNAFARAIVPIRQPSARASMLFADASVDWVFIDGSHIFEHVSKDIHLWTPKLRSGGIISGHDYVADCPGVLKAVDSRFPQRSVEDKIWWSYV